MLTYGVHLYLLWHITTYYYNEKCGLRKKYSCKNIYLHETKHPAAKSVEEFSSLFLQAEDLV
jgi:hypothetical protein